jgi:uncharacterized protein GlcG (DUF336 family)
MIASLDLPVQLNLHIRDEQSWQASQAVSIGVLGSSGILVVVERISGTLASGAVKAGKTFTLAERTTSGTSLQQYVNRIAQNLLGVSIPSKEADLQGEDQ